ncbi:MAG: siderophore-interacting protein [Spongiibacteraceae bacterium]
MKKMRMTQVAYIEDMGPHMRRIVLRGDDLNDFPSGEESAHFKAIFPSPGQTKPKLGIYVGFKQWMRSYTVRAFNNRTKELTVDFAVNDHEGLATNWAKNAQPGDYLGVAGPGEAKYTNYHADWHLIMADLTALPAAAAIMEKLPATAVGTAFLQVPTVKDKLIIATPNGVEVQWLINDNLNKNALIEGLENMTWRDGNPAIFVAGETSQTKAIKNLLKTKPGYISELTYASGYWKA